MALLLCGRAWVNATLFIGNYCVSWNIGCLLLPRECHGGRWSAANETCWGIDIHRVDDWPRARFLPTLKHTLVITLSLVQVEVKTLFERVSPTSLALCQRTLDLQIANVQLFIITRATTLSLVPFVIANVKACWNATFSCLSDVPGATTRRRWLLSYVKGCHVAIALLLAPNRGQCGPLQLELVLLSWSRRRAVLTSAILVPMLLVEARAPTASHNNCIVQEGRVPIDLDCIAVLLYSTPVLPLSLIFIMAFEIGTDWQWVRLWWSLLVIVTVVVLSRLHHYWLYVV